MEESQKAQGAYKIGNILLVDLKFSRKEVIDFEKEVSNRIDLNTEFSEGDDKGRIIVSVILSLKAIQNEEEVFSVHLKMTGVFMKEGTPTLSEEIFKKVNAPAIIYPFIREQVSSICLKAGLGNVILPPVNFVEAGNK